MFLAHFMIIRNPSLVHTMSITSGYLVLSKDFIAGGTREANRKKQKNLVK